MKILLHDLKEIITFVAYIVYLVSFFAIWRCGFFNVLY